LHFLSHRYDVESFGAGAVSNKIMDGYMDEIVVTEVTKNQQEKLTLEIFKQTCPLTS